jgi:hypothetical protein
MYHQSLLLASLLLQHTATARRTLPCAAILLLHSGGFLAVDYFGVGQAGLSITMKANQVVARQF